MLPIGLDLPFSGFVFCHGISPMGTLVINLGVKLDVRAGHNRSNGFSANVWCLYEYVSKKLRYFLAVSYKGRFIDAYIALSASNSAQTIQFSASRQSWLPNAWIFCCCPSK